MTIFKCLAIGSFLLMTGCKSNPDSAGLSEVQDPQLEGNQKARINETVYNATSSLGGALKLLGPSNLPVISPDVLAKTNCIISMQVERGAFLLGGSGGEGLMSCRIPGGWSAPSFLKTGGFDLGASIGWERLQTTMLVADQNLASAWRQNGSFEVSTYVKAIVGDASAALQSFGQNGLAVVQISNGGLYAGVGVSFSSLNHAQETRNQAVYGETLGGGIPTDGGGRSCSTYLLPGRRNGCIAEWQQRTGKKVTPVLPSQILSMPNDAAPILTKPFNDLLRNIP
jgi:lipid-binding SYLF domain-containing protein